MRQSVRPNPEHFALKALTTRRGLWHFCTRWTMPLLRIVCMHLPFLFLEEKKTKGGKKREEEEE